MNSTKEKMRGHDGREIAYPLRLNIGCHFTRIKGFTNVDIRPDKDVDVIADAENLSMFEDNSIEEIRASNVFEHFPHTKSLKVLKEWCRVLKPGGKLWISVPDFDFCVDFYLKCGRILEPWLIFHLWGEQKDAQEYHYIVFNWANLRKLLDDAGFSSAQRLESLPHGLKDASELRDTWYGMKCALNAEATK